MIIKSEAIALKITPFSETSRVVLWLTRDHGKIATIIKGAQRRRSPFVGQVDLFYTCELLFYLRLFRGLHIVKECFCLKPREPMRSRWRAAACASYFADLVGRISPRYAPHPELFRLLDMALDYFAEQAALELGLFWFELKLMKAMGLAPQLKECLRCHRPLQETETFSTERASAGKAREAAVFSWARGGVLCQVCAPLSRAAEAERATPITPDILALLRFWQASRSWRSALRLSCTPRQTRELERILGLFLQHHLEVSAPARAMAFTALRMPLSP
ncbi:MAG: DNA repair protein RecO [Lentisphaerae bacterium]|nr:DNA repair protein RecO [Lentisphaerota bacterium]